MTTTLVSSLTARHAHKCAHCETVIYARTQYRRVVIVEDGRARTERMHPSCYREREEKNDS